MPRAGKGDGSKERVRRILEALLSYASNELEDSERQSLEINWQTDAGSTQKLVVRTKLRWLEELTVKDSYPGKLNKEQIREALNLHLRDFLRILEDNRTKTQGSEDWHFTLKLWSRDKAVNLRQFDLEWEKRRPEKFRTKEDISPKSTPTENQEMQTSSCSQPLTNLPHRKTLLFIGRENERRRIKDALNVGTPRIRIVGLGGIGKTTLALEEAHNLLETKIFTAVFWVTFETNYSMTLSNFLDIISDSLSYEELKKLSFSEKQTSVLRILRSFKSLLVIDAFERANETDFYPFFTSIPSSCQLIITSRCMSHIFEEEIIEIKQLEQSECLSFIQAKSVNKRLSKAPIQTLAKIGEVTGGMPLALEWAVGQINTGRQTIENIINNLNGAYAEVVYMRLFADSYNVLSSEEKQILLGLSLFEDECSLLALKFVVGYDRNRLSENLRKLIETSLVYANDEFEEASIRYSIHPLLKNFVNKKGLDLHPTDLQIFTQRFIKYYENYIQQRQFQAKGHPQGSYQEFEVERRNINAALDKCYENRDGNTLLSFVTGLSYFYGTFGYWSERLRRGYQGIEACQWLNDHKNEAWILINEVGYVLIQQEHYNEAEHQIILGINILEKQIQELVVPSQEEEDIVNPLGLQFMLGIGVRYLAIIHSKRNEFAQAKEVFDRAFKIFTRLNRNTILANIRTEIGELAIRQGQYEQAKGYFHESLEYHLSKKEEKHWINSWIARAYNGLGDIAFNQNNQPVAKDCYEKAMESSFIIGNKEGIAYYKYRLALIAEQTGYREKALHLAHESLDLYTKNGKSNQIIIIEELISSLQ